MCECNSKRMDNFYKAKFAEQLERYEDMAYYMKDAVQIDGPDLCVEERNSLSLSYKNIVSHLRSSWRVLTTIAERIQDQIVGKLDPCSEKRIALEYRLLIEANLRKYCDEVIELLESHLLKRATTADAEVFYTKMKGDYLRYLAEVCTNNNAEHKEIIKKSKNAYESAMELASQKLSSADPIRLGLALNYSVFFYEILNLTDEAISLAQKTFDEAMTDLESISQDCYKDAAIIIQLLRDNLALWRTERVDTENVELKRETSVEDESV